VDASCTIQEKVYFDSPCDLLYPHMVEPGASSDEIREEIFNSFSSKIEESDIDDELAEEILTAVLADDPPYEFSDQLAGMEGMENEA